MPKKSANNFNGSFIDMILTLLILPPYILKKLGDFIIFIIKKIIYVSQNFIRLIAETSEKFIASIKKSYSQKLPRMYKKVHPPLPASRLIYSSYQKTKSSLFFPLISRISQQFISLGQYLIINTSKLASSFQKNINGFLHTLKSLFTPKIKLQPKLPRPLRL